MKAILDWKYNTNGDPMVDVGYFLMMFLQPSDYGYPALARLDLSIGSTAQMATHGGCWVLSHDVPAVIGLWVPSFGKVGSFDG